MWKSIFLLSVLRLLNTHFFVFFLQGIREFYCISMENAGQGNYSSSSWEQANSLKRSINIAKKRVRDGGSLSAPFEKTSNSATFGAGGSSSSSSSSLPVLPLNRIAVRGELVGHYGQIHGMDWLGDGVHCVSASQDSNLIVWNASTQLKTCSIRMQSAFVMSCAADHSGQNVIAVGGLDNTVTLYRLSDYENRHGWTGAGVVGPRRGSPGTVNPLQMSPEAASAVAAANALSSVPRVKNSYSSYSEVGMEGSVGGGVDGGGGEIALDARDSVRSSTISTRGKLLSAHLGLGGGFDQPCASLLGHEGYISGLAFCDKGATIISASDDGVACAWDVERGVCVNQYLGHLSGLTALAINPVHPSIFATSSLDKTVKVWDRRIGGSGSGGPSGASAASSEAATTPLLNASCTHHYDKNTSEVEAVAWFPDGNALVSGARDSVCNVYDLRCCGHLGSFVGSAMRTACNAVEFSASGRFLFAGYSDARVRVFDLSLGSQTEPVTTLLGHRRGVTTVKRCPLGDAVASAGLDGKIQVYA